MRQGVVRKLNQDKVRFNIKITSNIVLSDLVLLNKFYIHTQLRNGQERRTKL